MKSPIDRNVSCLVLATGIASVVTQLVLVREFLAQFQGNELIIALVFSGWLLLGGIGTRLAHWHRKGDAALLSGLSMALAVLPPIQMMAIRWLRASLFDIGAAVGFYPVLTFTLVTMAPCALLVGYLLPYSLFFLRYHHPDYPGVRIYMVDNMGDTCGGALFTFVLVIWATPMQALALAGLPLAIAAVPLMPRKWVSVAALVPISIVMATGILLEERSLAPPVGQLIHYEETPYARLTVQQDREQTTLFADGRPMAASHDIVAAEQIVHYPLSQLSRVQRVLLISAQGSVVEEIRKYQPDQLDYVELDPAVARLMDKFGLTQPLPQMELIQGDGRAWLRDCDRTYDAILLNLPEPNTFQLNRFFTERFFSLVDRHLSPRGVFCFTVQGAANYLTEAQRLKISCLRATALRQFRYVAVLPGERTVFLCRQMPLDMDIPRRLADMGIATNFVSSYFYGDITKERIEALRQALDMDIPINRDTRPYLMQVMTSQWFTLFGYSPYGFMLAMASGCFIYLLRMRREEYLLFSTGLVAMGSEIVLIFAFQIFLGYIYAKIGMIVTAMLAGLLPGAWLGHRYGRQPLRMLLFSDLLIIVWLVLLALFLFVGGDHLPSGFFYAAAFSISVLCGFQVPLALVSLGDDNRAAARLFAVDLIGAAFGALMTSTLLIPYCGLGGTIAVLGSFKVISLLIVGEKYVRSGSTFFYRR